MDKGINPEEILEGILREIEEELLIDRATDLMLDRDFWIKVLEKADKKRGAEIAKKIHDALPDKEPVMNVLSALYQVTALMVMELIKKEEEKHGDQSR
jgi:hypothetical protein